MAKAKAPKEVKPQIKAISFGGGVQSTAMVVLAIQGKIDFDVALFSNVGDDSEHPATLTYVRDIFIPWATQHNFPIHELQRVMRDGTTRTLWEDITREGSRSIKIPVRMNKTGAPGNRSCTSDYKIRVVSRWLRENGASKDNPALIGIGISTDEIQRVSNRLPVNNQIATYPLIDLGMNRSDCMSVIADAGLPVPPKSSCFFCPFHRPQAWAEMRRDEPELFEKSAQLEDHINGVRAMLGRDKVFLTGRSIPLREAIQPAQEMLFDNTADMDRCDSGYCWT